MSVKTVGPAPGGKARKRMMWITVYHNPYEDWELVIERWASLKMRFIAYDDAVVPVGEKMAFQEDDYENATIVTMVVE